MVFCHGRSLLATSISGESMSGTKYTFSAYPNDVPILEKVAKDKQFISTAFLIREIVGNWCADQRRAKRLRMPAVHYTSRGADDYTEAE